MSQRTPVIETTRRAWLGAVGACSLALAWPLGARASTVPVARRLVSVGGALTEVVYALGAEAQLVATDTTSLFPTAATQTPKVGYLRQLSAEGVLSLKPDALICTGEAGPALVLDQLRAAGVPVHLVPTSHDFTEVLRKVALVASVTGRTAEGQALAAQLQRRWEGVTAQVAEDGRHRAKPKALFILAHSGTPMVAGRGTAADALLRLAGADNVVQQFEGYRPLTAEAMAAVAPQVIVNSQQGIDAMGGVAAFWQRPELALTPAFARKALVTMEASHLLGFGPRMPEAVQTLHTQLLQATA